MGILDEAIKEHLELKRQHGAGESELKKLEDEAFGASERPGGEESASDPLAEAPTEFMSQPDLEGEKPAADAAEAEESAPLAGEAPARRRTEIADLQELPVESVEAAEEEPAMEHEAVPEAVEPGADATEPVEPEPAAKQAPPEPEPKTPEPEADAPEPEAAEETVAHSTEERHAIAAHPTEIYDVEEELGDAEPEVHALSEEDEEFWDEKRLSDELDQALETPIELQEPKIEAVPSPSPSDEEGESVTPDHVTDEAEVDSRPESDQPEPEERPAPQGDHEDVLDETPDFLEEAPEDDRLWFEQKPPKDFDFDD